eukprot:GFUD01003383.1.p1 GENE.GFUD01003383.1~~GFUD01003383.1.p1  ORF type:complete len:287 (-),score=98.98 GFUD01003383.1:37-897(-)
MTTPAAHPTSSTFVPAGTSDQEIYNSFHMEIPDPNRCTSSPQFSRPVTTSNIASSDILDTAQFYWVADSVQIVGDGVTLGSSGEGYVILECDDNVNKAKDTNVKGKTQDKSKQAPASPYGLFLRELKLKLEAEGKTLDSSVALAMWKALGPKEKAKYSKMYREEKREMGDSYRSDISEKKEDPEITREKKNERERLRQKTLRGAEAQKKNQEKVNIAKLKEMIEKKTKKIAGLEAMTDDLKKKIVECDIETKAVLKLIKGKEQAEEIMKGKYKVVFKHMTKCKKRQ